MNLLVLNESQKDAVKGVYNTSFELNPIVLANGTEWVLSSDVIGKPEFASVNDVLAALPVRDIAEDEFVVSEI